MAKAAYIGIGAAAGANARFWLGRWVQAKLGHDFPWGTFFVNMTGTFLIGLVMGLILKREGGEAWRLLLAVGLLGGYTTYSTFGYETLGLMNSGMWGRAALYTFGHLFVGILAIWMGEQAARIV
ncbi:MAG: fluoride efflux transporter CrcB [Armatimonadetes bacterium]|nr:fluoride efflux transporter CrcB [Armatimonadota bacterium]